ncbi:cell wall integrity protein scw1-like [Heracleum sosnowskyi]|uniref:Cell wall integrity protein scw1-like n=1 Tax=Heracleum sosnowskyi TaxID=360622 RepID=A0AAD8HYQ4_9APIA|nr:cell wall integrity protein scw1-like [Heracleum sosnowskyi]
MSLINHPPYDPYSYAAAPPLEAYAFPDTGNNNINTLFISGLPDDVSVREIHNLFRHRPGFESCQLKYTGRRNQVVAFATFNDHRSAIAVLHTLNGVKFDPETGHVLHIELARSNSRKRKSGSGPYVVIDKRKNSNADAQDNSSDDGDGESDLPTGPGNPESSDKDDIEIQKSGETEPNTAASENEQMEKNADGLQPCSTLFIANLGPTCTSDELKQVLSQYPGFNSLKVRDRGGMPVAFADFEELEQANVVMDALKDKTLPSSDRGGMHIEYARSKMRKPKVPKSKTA